MEAEAEEAQKLDLFLQVGSYFTLAYAWWRPTDYSTLPQTWWLDAAHVLAGSESFFEAETARPWR